MYLAEEEVDENRESPQDQIVQPPDEGWNIRLFLAHSDGVTPNGRLEALCGRDQWSRRSGRRVDMKRCGPWKSSRESFDPLEISRRPVLEYWVRTKGWAVFGASAAYTRQFSLERS